MNFTDRGLSASFRWLHLCARASSHRICQLYLLQVTSVNQLTQWCRRFPAIPGLSDLVTQMKGSDRDSLVSLSGLHLGVVNSLLCGLSRDLRRGICGVPVCVLVEFQWLILLTLVLPRLLVVRPLFSR